jgi:hypothetical protein
VLNDPVPSPDLMTVKDLSSPEQIQWSKSKLDPMVAIVPEFERDGHDPSIPY